MKAPRRLVERRPLLPGCLLLLVAEEPGHGYELAQRLGRWGFHVPGPGLVYRELRTLEEAGLVRSRYRAPLKGPVPRVYEVTPGGLRALDRLTKDLEDIEGVIDELRHRQAKLSPGSGAPREG
ncbi:MAG: PadR family transcriptional regulator [Acidimicrobiales bacterium]